MGRARVGRPSILDIIGGNTPLPIRSELWPPNNPSAPISLVGVVSAIVIVPIALNSKPGPSYAASNLRRAL